MPATKISRNEQPGEVVRLQPGAPLHPGRLSREDFNILLQNFVPKSWCRASEARGLALGSDKSSPHASCD